MRLHDKDFRRSCLKSFFSCSLVCSEAFFPVGNDSDWPNASSRLFLAERHCTERTRANKKHFPRYIMCVIRQLVRLKIIYWIFKNILRQFTFLYTSLFMNTSQFVFKFVQTCFMSFLCVCVCVCNAFMFFLSSCMPYLSLLREWFYDFNVFWRRCLKSLLIDGHLNRFRGPEVRPSDLKRWTKFQFRSAPLCLSACVNVCPFQVKTRRGNQ